MVTLEEELLNTLQDLKEDDFETFKWFLKRDGVLEGFSGIPEARLEKTTRRDTVDLMVQKYLGPGAREVTVKILEKISRNDLVQRFQTLSVGKGEMVISSHNTSGRRYDATNVAQNEEIKRKNPKLQWVQQFAVEVTLDPDTAHPHLILSGDGKQVHHGDVRRKLPDNPKRFYRCVNVFGEQGFSSGRSYFEVRVKDKTAWTLGVAKGSIDRKGAVTLAPKMGFWTVGLRDGDQYKGNNAPSVNLSPSHPPQKVGVFVDYEEGLVSFYDADAAELLHSFTGCSFTEKLYPFFSPCTNDNGRNSAPLVISPVNRPLKTYDFAGRKDYERKKAELMSIQQFAVEVTLDPDTAHPALILLDRKQVRCGDVCRDLPDNAKRFDNCVNILGEQSFSSGRSYFEVQVKGKTAWALGVAKGSIDRKGAVTLDPKMGFWTVWLRDGDQYEANDDQSVNLSLESPPQKVGVFVDYEEGRVSFYDVDAAELLYSFTGCSFTETLYPFFCPSTDGNGRNSAPLVVCPVNQND